MSPFRRFLALLALVLALPLGVRAAEAPRPGVEILILAREKTLALSSKKTGNYNCAPAVSMGAVGPEGFTGAEIWRLEEAGDGSFRILLDGQALGMEPGYNGIGLGDERYIPMFQYAKKHNLPILLHTWGAKDIRNFAH